MVQVRPATVADASFAVPLLQLSMGAIGAYLFPAEGSIPGRRVLEKLFKLGGNRFSYTFTDLVESDGNSVAILQTYPSRMMKVLDLRMGYQLLRILGFRQFLNLAYKSLSLLSIKEAEAGEYFINTVAVTPRAQGKGIGTAVLSLAEEKAKTANLNRCSLIVEINNIRARKLYERCGFQVTQTIRTNRLAHLTGIEGLHRMVKLIPQAVS